MKNIYTLALIAFLGVGLVMMGCGPSAEELLEGNWQSDCYVDDTDPAITYTSDVVSEWTQTKQSTVWTFWANEDPLIPLGPCEYPLYTITSDRDYSVASFDAGTGYAEMDYTVNSITMRVDDPLAFFGLQSVFNGLAVCGITDWVSGVDRDITGAQCDPPPAPAVSEVGDLILESLTLDMAVDPLTMLILVDD